MNIKLRSPFFYVGDKYKLMPQLIELFPQKINNYYEPFLGGGSSILYVDAKKYILNDSNSKLIELHKVISSYSNNEQELFNKLFAIVRQYQLSCSYLDIIVPLELKKKYIKTYYAKYNKQNYTKLRADYNLDNDPLKLYILLIYGFNHMIRFNKKGEFNLPVGNVDFNKNVINALTNYLQFTKNRNIRFTSYDYIDFIRNIEFKKGDFIYFDPPYLISNSEYNKNWSCNNEEKLYQLLDILDQKGVYFGLSNMLEHKGNVNIILKKIMQRYYVYNIQSNYISRFDNTVKKNSKEVYITNYAKN